MLVRFPTRQKISKFVQLNHEWINTLNEDQPLSDSQQQQANNQFFAALAHYDICITGLDWIHWFERSRLKELTRPQLQEWITTAGTGQLLAYLTALVRSERFCRGTIAESIALGTLQAVISGLNGKADKT
ncbi:DUF6508 domain-containing protein [Photobacterium sagamiensis]|uniref:DUF6508 domain-containing protein n=1 Tax=Photobacterium sagamiensis TaxID=2910241 RepID=UPI003D0DB197